MKVAILWTRLSGYLNSCLQELVNRDGVELFVCHRAPDVAAPYDDGQFNWMIDRLVWQSAPDEKLLQDRVKKFAPDILIFAGWHIEAYRSIAREFSGRCLRIMTMDNCWQGTLKQWAGVISAPYYVRPLADAVWLPGERQAVFARKLGFKEHSILRGLYACDQHRLEAPYLERIQARRPVPRRFIFVGRFVVEKGIEVLTRAYELYRNENSDPWPLVCCGAGPLRTLLEGRPGIRVEGFVQPRDLPGKLAGAGCLVLPSSFEPWALVVHEAASAGLLILASENVGATVHLVQPGYNGFISTCGDADELAVLLFRISGLSDARLDDMSRASHYLSQQFSPTRWADTILDCFHAWVNDGHVEQSMPPSGRTRI